MGCLSLERVLRSENAHIFREPLYILHLELSIVWVRLDHTGLDKAKIQLIGIQLLCKRGFAFNEDTDVPHDCSIISLDRIIKLDNLIQIFSRMVYILMQTKHLSKEEILILDEELLGIHHDVEMPGFVVKGPLYERLNQACRG